MSIFITGANRGLGLELLLECLRKDYHVYATVRHERAREQLLQTIAANGLHAEQLTTFICDVRSEADIEKIAQYFRASNIKLTSIMNSAAVLEARNTPIEQLDMNDVVLSFDVNLYGPMRVVKHLLPHLAREKASIINISSEAGSIQHAYGGDYPYSLSKCALNLFSEQLKRVLAQDDVQVWSIHPGWMHTDMGGPSAPLSPQESAQHIVSIIERKIIVDSELAFINYKGEPMKI